MSRYHSLFVLFIPSLSSLLCQIVMYFSSYLPAFFCLISLFDPFCVLRLLFLESVFCIDLTRSFQTLFWLSTSTHRLPFCFVALIGLIPGFDPWPVTTFMIWITFTITVCWKNDPEYGHSHCLWIFCIALICACVILTKENKDSVLFIWVFAFGSSSASSDNTIASRNFCRFVSCTFMLRMSYSTTSQRYSIGFRSSEWEGH